MTAAVLAAAAADAPSPLPDWIVGAFDVREPWELWWVGFGLLAQGAFFARWIIQWIASERHGKSVVPVAFWWTSLVGASMLLVYFIVRREPVGIIGQLTGWTIYSRNLWLINKAKKRSASSMAGSAEG